MMIQTTFLQPERIYHVYNRGNNRENIFKREDDCRRFMTTWEKHIAPVAIIYAYCLIISI